MSVDDFTETFSTFMTNEVASTSAEADPETFGEGSTNLKAKAPKRSIAKRGFLGFLSGKCWDLLHSNQCILAIYAYRRDVFK